MKSLSHPSRRQFLETSAIATGATFLGACSNLPRRTVSPNSKLNIAAVGVGGKGRSDLELTSKGQNVVALCDVDDLTLAAAGERFPGARRYHDWRQMLEQRDIDAVTVSTPDHMHAPVALSAMQLGKHVYVQKPLAHTIQEARQLTKAARDYRVVTQMGNQHHSGAGYKTLVQAVRQGAIGKVREAHTWSNRPIWPQGITRPKGDDAIPPHLWWDLWLGVAPYRPYVGGKPGEPRSRGAYHSFNWRGFLDFGVGALGDMGCHIIDPVVWGLELGAAGSVVSTGPATNGETFPGWQIIHYEFPGTTHTAGGTFKLTWYDGGKKPEAKLFPGLAATQIPSNGSLFIGEQAALLCSHGGQPQLLGGTGSLEELPGEDHYQQWTNACKGEGRTSSHFAYSGPMTETVLLGTIAVRFPNRKLEWDAAGLKFTNAAEANAFVHKQYRPGWSVRGLA